MTHSRLMLHPGVSQDHSLPTRGQSLNVADRVYFESKLQTDLSQVRIHTDPLSASSAAAMGTNAFASGDDIAFAPGQYQPGTSAGRQLLAHELSHVLQQRMPPTNTMAGLQTGSMSSASAEQHATQSAQQVTQGASVAPEQHGSAAPGVYCEEPKKKPVPPPAAVVPVVPLLPKVPMVIPDLQPQLGPRAQHLPPDFLKAPEKPRYNGKSEDLLSTEKKLGYLDKIAPGLSELAAPIALGSAQTAAQERDNPDSIQKANAESKLFDPSSATTTPKPSLDVLEKARKLQEYLEKKKQLEAAMKPMPDLPPAPAPAAAKPSLPALQICPVPVPTPAAKSDKPLPTPTVGPLAQHAPDLVWQLPAVPAAQMSQTPSQVMQNIKPKAEPPFVLDIRTLKFPLMPGVKPDGNP
ncbi:MAG: DUF4157 domain-containing protein [Burkholderiales bacterium]|nr:DUF4157 domain-containing protein [Burkholderiales bacterium]